MSVQIGTAFEVVARLPTGVEVVDQRVWLPERVRGLRVAHLGCVDEPLTNERIGTGELLHEELDRTAGALVGVDISADGIERLRAVVPGSYVCGNIEELDVLPISDIDLVLAAEVIEHLPSPGRFLSSLATVLAREGARGIITTPNAYSWRMGAQMYLRRREVVHPDHLLAYTPATLLRALDVAGLQLERLRVHSWSPGRGARKKVVTAIDRAALAWNPYLAVGLIVEVSPAG